MSFQDEVYVFNLGFRSRMYFLLILKMKRLPPRQWRVNPRPAGVPKLAWSAGGGGRRLLTPPPSNSAPRRCSEKRLKAFERSSKIISKLL